jgi:hypothetical protein
MLLAPTSDYEDNDHDDDDDDDGISDGDGDDDDDVTLSYTHRINFVQIWVEFPTNYSQSS